MKLDELSNSEIAYLIDEYIHNARDRSLLKDRLIDGMRFEPLAEKYDLSVRHTKALVYKAEEKLFRHIRKVWISLSSQAV